MVHIANETTQKHDDKKKRKENDPASQAIELTKEELTAKLDKNTIETNQLNLQDQRSNMRDTLESVQERLETLLNHGAASNAEVATDVALSEYLSALREKVADLRSGMDSKIPAPFVASPTISIEQGRPAGSDSLSLLLSENLTDLRALMQNDIVKASPELKKELGAIVSSLEVLLNQKGTDDRPAQRREKAA